MYRRTLACWTLLSAFALGGEPPEVRLSFQEPEYPECLAISPDGTQLAVGESHGSIFIYDPGMGQRRAVLKGHDKEVRAVAFRPDGGLLASAGWDETICLWDTRTWKKTRTITAADIVETLAFSPDGRTLASGGWDNAVTLWEVESGRRRATLVGHRGTIDTLVFRPDGETLASTSWDDDVRLWDVESGACRAVLKGHWNLVQGAAFSPDGRWLYTAAKDIKVWDVATGEEVRTIEDDTPKHIYSLALSPDGRTLATGKFKGDVTLWDIATGTRRTKFEENTHIANSLLFTPDGSNLIGAWAVEGVKVWDLAEE
jgi:WD40 repeat protein